MVESSNTELTLEKLSVADYIGFSADASLMALINGEKLFFADKIKKTNMFEWTQERTFVVTNMGLYNIHKKAIKRHITIKDIGGLTKTIPPSKVMEFTVHVPTAYDYRFISDRREEIINLLKKLYIISTGKSVPIFNVTDKNLKEFTTTESDMKKNVSRFPSSNHRNLKEDLFPQDKLVRSESKNA